MKNLKEITNNAEKRTVVITACSLALNLIYSFFNLFFGIQGKSPWLITLAAYYIILSIMRFSAVLCQLKSPKNPVGQQILPKVVGILLIFLSIVLSGTTVLSVIQGTGRLYNEIAMLAVATYSFTKITLAIINIVKSKKYNSYALKSIRYISFADAAASIYSLQRSMLVTYNGMSEAKIAIFNAATGTAVSIVVFILGILLITRRTSR